MMVENIEEPISFDLNAEAIERLKEFKNKISTEGLVSRSDVLAVENFIGNKLITTIINPNSISNTPTPNRVEEICKVIDKQLEKTDVTTNITYSDLTHKVPYAEHIIKRLIDFIKSGVTVSTDEETIFDRFENNNYNYYYDENDNIVDLLDVDIITVITEHTDFIYKVLDKHSLKKLETIKWTDVNTLPLLSMLKHKNFSQFLYNPNFNMDLITIRDILNIVRNSGKYVEDLKLLLEVIENDVKNIRDDYKWMTSDLRSLTRLYNKYKMLTDLITSDNASLTLLDIFFKKDF